MSIVKKFLLVFVLLLQFGCKNLEPPVFKSIEDLNIELLNTSKAMLKANAVLHNPNSKKIVIKHLNISLTTDDKTIATIDKEMNVEAFGLSDFTVPVDIEVNLGDLNLNNIGAALGLFGLGGQKVRYLGKIKVKAYGIRMTVPIDFEDNIKLSF